MERADFDTDIRAAQILQDYADKSYLYELKTSQILREHFRPCPPNSWEVTLGAALGVAAAACLLAEIIELLWERLG